jgi:predicted O-linked N-acetylglucosamine transferase (SPINDLY family)
MQQFQAAAQSYQHALKINPELPEAHQNLGIAYREMGQTPEAIQCFERAIELRPDYTLAHCNLSQVFNECKDPDQAFHHAHIAVTQQPGWADAHVRLGDALLALHRKQEAMQSYLNALNIVPFKVDASLRLVTLYISLGDYLNAHDLVDKTLQEDPSLLGKDTWWTQWLLIKSKLCEWSNWEELRGPLAEEGPTDVVINPFLSIAQSNSPAVLKRVASRYALENFGQVNELLKFDSENKSADGRIVVGYFSADFRNHPIAFLMSELFEKHDQQKFKIICFSYGLQDDYTLRIRNAVEEFCDVWGFTDEDILKLARSKHLDIAIDLGGYTEHSKLSLFAKRVAPVQASYLGYLGSLAADFMDYLIADETIIPTEYQSNYSEKIAYLPCYQVNDSQRKASEKEFLRTDLGLPEKGVVFCCFNNTFKFNPETFRLWMKILLGVPHSTLFVYAENEVVANHLKSYAQGMGVSPNRLMFAQRIPVADYLARYKIADLFLDTFPYNAGTTASDALWMGVPVLTRPGAVFASRVAASLLNALGVPELIANSPDDYVNKAIELGNHPERLVATKQKLALQVKITDLFNTPKFVRSIEQLFAVMYKRHRSGLQPDVIRV